MHQKLLNISVFYEFFHEIWKSTDSIKICGFFVGAVLKRRNNETFRRLMMSRSFRQYAFISVEALALRVLHALSTYQLPKLYEKIPVFSFFASLLYCHYWYDSFFQIVDVCVSVWLCVCVFGCDFALFAR